MKTITVVKPQIDFGRMRVSHLPEVVNLNRLGIQKTGTSLGPTNLKYSTTLTVAEHTNNLTAMRTFIDAKKAAYGG